MINQNLPIWNEKSEIKSLTDGDLKILQGMKNNEWFLLLRLYVPLFFGLVGAYYQLAPKYPPHSPGWRQMSILDFIHVFEVFAAVFGIIFMFFLIRDYRRMILPYKKEVMGSKKYFVHFTARKYEDPIFHKRLIFYPGKTDLYISFEEEEYLSIQEGESLYMEMGVVTGEILLLKSDSKKFETADEFRFVD